MPLTPEQSRILEEYQRKLPRFLFRGFHAWSGGGVDPRLNSTEGVIPHGFLRGQRPTSINDIPDLTAMLAGHLTGEYIPSCFSSWAADLEVAIGFSEYDSYNTPGYIAVVDTNLLEDHVRVYHVLALYHAGLVFHNYYKEYLAYGPVTGPAYHCVKNSEIQSMGLTPYVNPGWTNNTLQQRLAWEDPGQFFHKIRNAALLFRRADDGRPDVVLAAAAVLGAFSFPTTSAQDRASFIILMNQYFPEELASVRLPTTPSAPGHLGLVNRDTFTNGSPELQDAVRILIELEDNITHHRPWVPPTGYVDPRAFWS